MHHHNVRTIGTGPVETRRTFTNDTDYWTVIYRERFTRRMNAPACGVGDWWRTLDHTYSHDTIVPGNARHDLPLVAAGSATARPARLIVCDMPFTGADINTGADDLTNITRMATFNTSSYMETRGGSTVNIYMWISPSRWYVYTQLSIRGEYHAPMPQLTPIVTATVEDEPDVTCWCAPASATLPRRGFCSYLRYGTAPDADWTADWWLPIRSTDAHVHNHAWHPGFYTEVVGSQV